MRYLLLALLLLQSCGLLKKKVDRERHQESTQTRTQHAVQSGQKQTAETTRKTSAVTAELKQDETLIQTVKEVYDTTGRIKARTTTVTRAKTHKESTRQATIDLKQEIKQADSTTEKVAQTQQKQQESKAVHKDVKRSGLSIWICIALVASLGLVVWKKSLIKHLLSGVKSLFKP
ncbi:MAG: hypothetical protein V6Z82_04090 [Flavobacteriales bacterium]